LQRKGKKRWQGRKREKKKKLSKRNNAVEIDLGGKREPSLQNLKCHPNQIQKRKERRGMRREERSGKMRRKKNNPQSWHTGKNRFLRFGENEQKVELSRPGEEKGGRE